MKQKNNFFRRYILLLLGILSMTEVMAQENIKQPYLEQFDSVEVSLLTCSPHEEIYSLYGHSAIRWHDLRDNKDIVFNWGVFDFRRPYFVLRFVFGLTDYELGAFPYDYFWPYYKQCGSSVMEQILNLTNEEKLHMYELLHENQKPENKVYRYNYFYDNCSTRPRDIVEKCVNGRIEYAQREDYTPSYRDMVHECVRNHPWAAFGNDMLLGVKADLKTTLREQEFLPENLMYDFSGAQIYAGGEYRPLVKENRLLVPPGVQIIEQDFPLTPRECAWGLLIISIILLVFEWKRKKTFKYWDALLMLFQGLAGCVLFVMLFSQHPTTSTNLQILLLNPIPLYFIPAILRRKPTRWWRILCVMAILFVCGSFFQQYAEGMMIVALCLLLRVLINLKYKA